MPPWQQALLRECRGLHGDLEAMGEREGQLAEVVQTEGWSQQVTHLSRRTEELQQHTKTRLQSLQDAAKVEDKRGRAQDVHAVVTAIDKPIHGSAMPCFNKLQHKRLSEEYLFMNVFCLVGLFA